MRVQSLRREDPLVEEMAARSRILAWETSWTEEPGRLQSMGSQRVGHDLETKQPLPPAVGCFPWTSHITSGPMIPSFVK